MMRFSKEKLRDEMKRRKIKVPALEKATGIPRDRVYAWYRDNTNPKREDQDILEKWLNNLPIEKNGEMKVTAQNPPDPLPMGETVITLADYINQLKDTNRFLQDSIQANLNLALAYMGKMDTQSEAARKIVLESLSRLEKKPEGSLNDEADKEALRIIEERKIQGIAVGKHK